MSKIIQEIFVILLLLSFFAFCASEGALDSIAEEEAPYTSSTEAIPETTETESIITVYDPLTEQACETVEKADTTVPEEGNGESKPQEQKLPDAISEPVVFSAKITVEIYPSGDIVENTVFSLKARVSDANMEYTLRWEEHDTANDRPGVAQGWKLIGKESVIKLTAGLDMNKIEYRLVITGADKTELIVPVKPFHIILAPETEEITDDQNNEEGPVLEDEIIEEAEEPVAEEPVEIDETEPATEPEAELPDETEPMEEQIEEQSDDASDTLDEEVPEQLIKEPTDEAPGDAGDALTEEPADEKQVEEAIAELPEAADEVENKEPMDEQASEPVEETIEKPTEELDTEQTEGLDENAEDPLEKPITETTEELIPELPEAETDIQDETVPTTDDIILEEPAGELDHEVKPEAQPEEKQDTEHSEQPEYRTEVEPGVQLEAEQEAEPEAELETETETLTEPEEHFEEVPESEPEGQPADTEAPAEESARRVTIHSSAGNCIMSGTTIVLTVELEGFEENDNIVVIWEVNKGDGWESVGIGETYEYTASLESLMWDIRAKVQYQAVQEAETEQ